MLWFLGITDQGYTKLAENTKWIDLNNDFFAHRKFPTDFTVPQKNRLLH